MDTYPVRGKIHFQKFFLAYEYPDCGIENLFCSNGPGHRYAGYHRTLYKSVGIPDANPYIDKNSFNLMLKISDEDYRFLESKIQAEIKKVLAQFREERENKTARPGGTDPVQEQRKPARPGKILPAETTTAEPKKQRKSKNNLDINRILQSTAPAGIKTTKKILEDDMDKIFRKKQKRKSP
jgi:hypothetical protein